MTDKVIRALIAGLLGSVVGWSANALTLGGRVTAIEQALLRIEARLEVRADK